jgi:hypothetical protein
MPDSLRVQLTALVTEMRHRGVYSGDKYGVPWVNRIAAILRESPAEPSDAGTWPRCVQRAFVDGAKWWEWHQTHATMWPSDRDLAEAEAVRRYGEPAPPAPGYQTVATMSVDATCAFHGCALARRAEP